MIYLEAHFVEIYGIQDTLTRDYVHAFITYMYNTAGAQRKSMNDLNQRKPAELFRDRKGNARACPAFRSPELHSISEQTDCLHCDTDLRPVSNLRRSTAFSFLLFIALLPVMGAQQQLPKPLPADPNPWNGTWRLDPNRSSPGTADQAADAYRFTLGPSGPASVTIKWEIPSLGEIVIGRTDGRPMTIHRSKPTPGLTLSVRTEGTSVLRYQVFKDSKLTGGGRMMLVDQGKSWVDLTWPLDRQDLASELVYVKQ